MSDVHGWEVGSVERRWHGKIHVLYTCCMWDVANNAFRQESGELVSSTSRAVQCCSMLHVLSLFS